MAEIKISELTANGANLQTTDRIPTAVDDGMGGFVTRYVTGDEVIGAVSKTTVPVRNQSGATIYKGTIVYISSAAGNKLLISKSLANSEATSARTLGVVTANIPNNSNGNVQTSGILTNLDTRSSATHPFTSVTLAEGDTTKKRQDQKETKGDKSKKRHEQKETRPKGDKRKKRHDQKETRPKKRQDRF